jgi:hypothetical protein
LFELVSSLSPPPSLRGALSNIVPTGELLQERSVFVEIYAVREGENNTYG